MKKCVLSSLLAITMIFSLSTAAFAYEPEFETEDSLPAETETTVTVNNYSEYLSVTDIENLKNGVSASITTENGEIIPMDCTVTIEDVDQGEPISRQMDGRTYTMTVSATTKTVGPNNNSINYNGVNATVYLSMEWTDVSGIANTLDRLYGRIDLKSGSINNARVYYGDTHNRPIPRKSIRIYTDESFDLDINYTSTSITGNLHGCYQTWFDGVPDSKMLTVCVDTSIFD